MPQDRWNDVKSKVEGLGLKLKLHLEQEDDETDDHEGGATESSRKSLDDLGDKIEDAFEAFGKAAKDPAVRADVKEIGLLIKDAIQETLTNVGAEVGDTFKKAGDRVKEAAPGAGSGSGPLKDSDDDALQDTVADGDGAATDEDAN